MKGGWGGMKVGWGGVGWGGMRVGWGRGFLCLLTVET